MFNYWKIIVMCWLLKLYTAEWSKKLRVKLDYLRADPAKPHNVSCLIITSGTRDNLTGPLNTVSDSVFSYITTKYIPQIHEFLLQKKLIHNGYFPKHFLYLILNFNYCLQLEIHLKFKWELIKKLTDWKQFCFLYTVLWFYKSFRIKITSRFYLLQIIRVES